MAGNQFARKVSETRGSTAGHVGYRVVAGPESAGKERRSIVLGRQVVLSERAL